MLQISTFLKLEITFTDSCFNDSLLYFTECSYRCQIAFLRLFLDIDYVSEEPYVNTEETELEEADLFSDPEDDLYQHMHEVRRSLSLDSEGTEPETQRGNVLAKVAFFETFQRSFEVQSPSNSESSFRRSLIQDELEEFASLPKTEEVHEEEEQEQPEQEEEEHECQLEFDDLFPAHREGDEAEAHEDVFEDEAEEEEESLVSVSDAEDVLDFADFDTRPQRLEDYEFEDSYCETHEFIEEEPSTMEIFDFSDEEASHQYADISDTEEKPLFSTKRVLAPMNLGTATEFHKTESFKLCKDEPPDLMEDAPHSYSEEKFEIGEATVEMPQTSSTRPLDPDHCFVATKRQEVDVRMEEIISKIGLLPVEDSVEDSDELFDFNKTTEGQLLHSVLNSRNVEEPFEIKTPVEEICEASHKSTVESEIDFDKLFVRLEGDETGSEEEYAIPQTSRETERRESTEDIHVVLRDHESERSADMERVRSDIGLESLERLEDEEMKERELTPDITLTYECQSSVAVQEVEPVLENIEAAERDHKPESEMDLKELEVRMEIPMKEETARNEISEERREASNEEESCKAVLRDHHREHDRILEEIGLVRISPDIIHLADEPVEPLRYERAPTSTVGQLPEVTENISAEVRGDVRCEVNLEELFHNIDEDEESILTNKERDTQRFETIQDSIETFREERPCEPVLRDHDQERTRDLEDKALQLELVPVSTDVAQSHEQVEPLSYDYAPSSPPKSQLPEILEHIGAETRQDVRSEINFEEMFRRLEQEDTIQADELANAQCFEENETTMTEKPSRASLHVEEDTTVGEVVHCAPSSSQHVSHEKCENLLEEEVEEIEQTEEEKRASLYMEEDTFLGSVTLEEVSSKPLHVAGETLDVEPATQKEEVEVEEQTADELRTSVFMEEEIDVNCVTTDIASSPLHIAVESADSESVEVINKVDFGEEEKKASLFLEEDSVVNEVKPGTLSSPKHIAGESQNEAPFQEIDEELTEERKRASLFSQEPATLDEVMTDTPSSPKHVVMESRNVETFEEIDEEPNEKNKRASLFVEEAPCADEVTTDAPSSPKHIAGESNNVVVFEEVDEEMSEGSQRASLHMEEAVTVDEVTTNTPSSPKHLVGQGLNLETFEEVATVPYEKNQRASVFLEENSFVDELTTVTSSVSVHTTSDALSILAVEKTHEEEEKPNQEHAEELEDDSEVRYGYISPKSPDQNNHVAGEVSNCGLLEVTDDDESPESDFGEHIHEFEQIYANEPFVEPPQSTHVAGEIKNINSHDEALEEVLQIAESLEYEETQKIVTTTDPLETPKPSFHIAGKLSKVEPREESSEEEKPEEEACAEEYEETEVQASTLVLRSPQSLVSIAVAALEHKIDAAQQDATEEIPMESGVEKQYSEEEQADAKLVVSETLPPNAHLVREFDGSKQHEETVEVTTTSEQSLNLFEDNESTDVTVTDADTEVPVIVVNIAGDISDNEDENVVFEEEKPQEDRKIDAQTYQEQEETVIEYPTNEQPVSQSHVVAEVCVSEFVLEEEETEEQRESVEPFEESEEGSVSELLSECSSSPLHVSTELKDFQDYETINEEYCTETYRAIMYEKGEFVPEKSISKGLPSLFITEELTPHKIYEEIILNEQSVVIETAQDYSEVEEPLQTQTILDISQPSIQTAAELSDTDFNEGVDEEDELSEREFAEEFVDTKGVYEQTSLKGSATTACEIDSKSDPQIAQEEGGLTDETDNTQKLEIQEHLVNIEQSARETTPVILAALNESVIHKKEKILEQVWEVEIKKDSPFVDTTELDASQIQKLTILSEKEQKYVKSSYQVLESKESFSVSQTHRGESVIVSDQGIQMEFSHEMEERIEVFSTRTMRPVSSSSFQPFQYQFETNGASISQQLESSDQLSESILDKETKDQELEKYEKQLSEEETEVRLLKSEVMEYKAAERQVPLVSPSVTVERETTLVKTLVVQSSAKEDREEVLMREDRITAILKDDEASLEEESAGEQFEEEIDIVRMDEALSEEEFRGEGAENIDRVPSRSSKADSVEEIDKNEDHVESEVHKVDEETSLYEEEVEIRRVEPCYEDEFGVKKVEGQVDKVSHETDDSVVEASRFEEEVEVATFEGSDEPANENLETVGVTEIRTQSPVFEEELEVSAIPREDDSIYIRCTEGDKQVDQSSAAVFEEELEVSAFTTQYQQVEEHHLEENKLIDHSAVFEEELEVSTYKGQEGEFEEQHTEEQKVADETLVSEEELEVSAFAAQNEPTEETHSEDEDHGPLPSKYEEIKPVDDETTIEKLDEEKNIELVETAQMRRQPLDLTQVDLYDEEESASATRYYVELSSTESLEQAYGDVEGGETSYTETYVRQGEPLEENLEEFILVRYGDEFESSGEEDISDHREIYVIPEEDNDVENNDVEAARDETEAEEPFPESFYEEGFENMALEGIRESPEFDIDDSDELDEEEQRQLEEYERLESFVILEEKLSQVESDDDESGDFPREEGDENVFHSDVHSSSDETLHEDELGETMTACSIRQAAVSTETECKEEASQDDDCSQAKDQGSGEHQETPKECSSHKEESRPVEGIVESKAAGEVSSDEERPKPDTEDESLQANPTRKKDDSDSSRTKEEKTEQCLSSDSSGEQSVSSEGSLSSTTSADLEG